MRRPALFFFIGTLLAVDASASYPLFKAFPELEARLPRVALDHSPSPVEELRGLAKLLNAPEGRLWVKRDDRSWEPLGGNKTRKLELLLGEAGRRGIRTLVTSGMYGSNHALTTAHVARQLGYKTRLILGPQPVTAEVRKKLLAMHALGAELSFNSSRIGMGLEMLRYMIAGPWLERRGTYYLPPGGSNDIGSVGYVNAFFELLEQVGAAGMPEAIVVPVGTGGTAAGLLVGSCLAGFWEKVAFHGVETVDPLLYNERKLRKDARSLYDSLVAQLDPARRVPRCDFGSERALTFSKEFYPPRYGAAKPPVDKAIALLRQTDGLVMDITYSGKALAYFLELVKRRAREKTLFWHTYNSYPLDSVVDAHPWRDPSKPWLDLPKPFHRLFRSAD